MEVPVNSTDSALPASRQPMPVAPQVKAEIDRRGRSAQQIERDLAQRAEHLSATIDELTTRLQPKRLAKDGVDRVKERVTTEDGRPRREVVAALAGAVLVVGVLIWRTRRG